MSCDQLQFGFAEGIAGIIEESFLEVTHNKQDYSDNTATVIILLLYTAHVWAWYLAVLCPYSQ